MNYHQQQQNPITSQTIPASRRDPPMPYQERQIPTQPQEQNYSYNPNLRYEYAMEEQPMFANENVKNVNRYRSYMKTKQEQIDSYSQNYLNYLLARKNPSTIQRTVSPPQRESPISSLYQRSNRLNDITNPDLFYKQSNQEYYQYKEQQRKCLDFNLSRMGNERERKRRIDVNPYNKNGSIMSLGESTLVHNTILNPLPNYTYNKYLEKEILAGSSQRSSSSFKI